MLSCNITLAETVVDPMEQAILDSKTDTRTEAQINADDQKALADAVKDDSTKAASDNKKITTIVSEKVPGASCVCFINNNPGGVDCPPGTKITERKYQCTTESGMTGFQKVFAQLIRFVINIVMLLGVLAVVGLGIAWSFAGGDDVKMKSTLKSWAINIVIGFIILFMFRYILLFLAPWIYR